MNGFIVGIFKNRKGAALLQPHLKKFSSGIILVKSKFQILFEVKYGDARFLIR
jgi:hypothetical protein